MTAPGRTDASRSLRHARLAGSVLLLPAERGSRAPMLLLVPRRSGTPSGHAPASRVSSTLAASVRGSRSLRDVRQAAVAVVSSGCCWRARRGRPRSITLASQTSGKADGRDYRHLL